MQDGGKQTSRCCGFLSLSPKFCGWKKHPVSHDVRLLIENDVDRYSILAMTLLLAILGVLVLGSRRLSEGFAAAWSGLMLCALSVGGTMIMRKFHSSLAVGFFMGCVVAMSQMFFMLFLV